MIIDLGQSEVILPKSYLTLKAEPFDSGTSSEYLFKRIQAKVWYLCWTQKTQETNTNTVV